MKIAFAALALTAALLSSESATSPTMLLAYGPSVDPTGPISGATGAPTGDARYGTDPLVPYGTNPQVPTAGIDMDHDLGLATNGQVDLPF